MSMIIHRCTSCTHPEEWHSSADCMFGFCRCSKVDPGEPEVIPTFYVGSQDQVPTLHAPGSMPFGERYHPGTRTCACDACQQEYARLGGVA